MASRRDIIRGVGALVASASLQAEFGRASPRETGAAQICEQVVELVEKNFVFPERVEQAKAAHRLELVKAATPTEAAAAIDKFLCALGVSHTARYLPSSLDYYESLDIYRPRGPRALAAAFPPDGAVSYAGIGVATETFGHASFVTAIYADTPAEAASFQIGDEIVEVDGRPFHAGAVIGGPVGSEKSWACVGIEASRCSRSP